ncbi:MAG: DUF438 domain-containing protein [Clostridiaceae bacterium]|jgi:DUF438 domain-containing protein|nr:DUF438 domain-containing protein [Clostridiaceae bacterium]
MSELINNSRQRRDQLKALIQQLHDGKTVDEVRGEFEAHFGHVSAAEIAKLEQELVQDGLPATEIQRLCDVHAAVFKGSIEEIHRPTEPAEIPGHPVQVFQRENRHLERLMAKEIEPLLAKPAAGDVKGRLLDALEKLVSIDIHYSRKENLLFPYLEKNGVTAPPKVMWGVDDEIRAQIKAVRQVVAAWSGQQEMTDALRGQVEDALVRVREMVFKEENILLPLALETLSEAEWGQIAQESADIGYCLIKPESVYPWRPQVPAAAAGTPEPAGAMPEGMLRLPSGILKLDEIVRLLDTLPFDLTFVDAEDTVRYFSQGKDRIFARTKAIIGRKVVHCHPPASVHVVEEILDDFKAGQRDQADFWIHMGPRYVLIRYYAVRDESGAYLGTLEVTQDIAPIQAISGDKRLLDG